MERACIGIVAAMPQEIAPVLQLMGAHRRERVDGFNVYRFALGEMPVLLIESGMGPVHAAAATGTLISHAQPKVILNIGFAGAVLPGMAVGAPVLAERVYLRESGEYVEAPRPDPGLSSVVRIALNLARVPLLKGSFITAPSIMNKKEVAEQVGETMWNAALEMETAAVLRTAAPAGIPVIALRTVSDAAHEELGFSLDEFCDRELNLRLWRILFCVARKPWIVPQLLRLSKNAKRAGENLALCVDLALKALAREL